VSYKSTEDAANAILKILGEEEQELAAVLKIEKAEKRPKSNRMMVSLKKGGQTFRITFDWVRDEYIAYHGFHLGNGYIEKEWDLALRPEKEAVPVVPPFFWKVRLHDASIRQASHPEKLTEDWLRQLIRNKLAIPQ
jgi:hypothetical protein